MTWRIRVLGALTVERDDRNIPLDALRKRERALLAMLALRRGRVVPKDELAETLFGHLDPGRASANLRVAASRLRAALDAPTIIDGAEGGYRMGSDVALDAEEFESSADAGRSALTGGQFDRARAELETANGAYRGDVLETETDAEWAGPMRTRLRARRLDAMDDLADAYLGLARPRDAVAVLERAVEVDRARESSYRRLMTAHYAAGEQDAALRAYERCRQALDLELGVDPGAETMTLHARIVRGEPIAAPPAGAVRRSTHVLPFVARTAERIALDAVIARAARGGAFVLVVGEPGAGKTRLVEESLHARSDVSVLATRCFELERDLPFQPLRDALGDRSPAPSERAALVEGFARAVLASGQGRPLVWWIDDVQWADESTLEVMHFVARRSGAEHVAIVAAGHATGLPPEHPATRVLTELRREGRAERISLMPFTMDDVATLARASRVSADAATLHARSGGNAFFVAELLMALKHGSGSLPETARDAVLARTHTLADETRRALDAAAVLSGRFRAREIAVVADLDDGATARALGSLESNAFLRPLPNNEHELAHQLVRDAVYGDIPTAARSALHKRAIDAVDGVRGADGASLVCYHAELAGDADCAFACAVTAGERALAAGAGIEALASFDRALRQPSDAESRQRCLGLQADAKRLLGVGNTVEAPG